jgi:arabinogalactan endo-1,4-beta-galactosidase
MDSLSERLRAIINAHGKPVMIVETAYPHTLANTDAAGNILGDAALVSGMPATPQGQLEYLRRLTEAMRTGGGSGVIYWEPAWVSSAAKTPWGTGSHWDNATFFDAAKGNEVLLGMGFYRMR